MKNTFIYEEYINKNYNTNLLYGGIIMQNIKEYVKVETRYVITKDGIRMTYEEYIEMIKSERD